MQRPVRDIGQRGVLVAHEAVEGAAAQAQQSEAADSGARFHAIPPRVISIAAMARSGPPGANATLPANPRIRNFGGRHLRAFRLRISREKFVAPRNRQ